MLQVVGGGAVPLFAFRSFAARVIFLPRIIVNTNRQENPTQLLMMTIQEFV